MSILNLYWHRFSSVSRPIGSSVGHEGRFSRYPLLVFSAGGPREQFWHGQGSPLSDVHPAFPLPTTVSPALRGALKDDFAVAPVKACNANSLKYAALCSKQLVQPPFRVCFRYIYLHLVFSKLLRRRDGWMFIYCDFM